MSSNVSTLPNATVDMAAKPEFISDEDRHTLDMIKMKRALAIANAEKSELAYSNLVLQLTLKYSLKEKDVITEQGEILRGTGV